MSLPSTKATATANKPIFHNVYVNLLFRFSLPLVVLKYHFYFYILTLIEFKHLKGSFASHKLYLFTNFKLRQITSLFLYLVMFKPYIPYMLAYKSISRIRRTPHFQVKICFGLYSPYKKTAVQIIF